MLISQGSCMAIKDYNLICLVFSSLSLTTGVWADNVIRISKTKFGKVVSHFCRVCYNRLLYHLSWQLVGIAMFTVVMETDESLLAKSTTEWKKTIMVQTTSEVTPLVLCFFSKVTVTNSTSIKSPQIFIFILPFIFSKYFLFAFKCVSFSHLF